MLGIFKRKRDFDDINHISRDDLIKKSRILIIDDDGTIMLKDFLQQQGFSVDHDKLGNDLGKYTSGLYDLIILDYHGVGNELGGRHGLDLMRFLNKNLVSTRVLAYTSRSLSAAESDFFKMAHAVLQKDLGLADSMEIIEDQLRTTFDKNYIFENIAKELGIKDEAQKNKLKAKIVSCIEGGDRDGVAKYMKAAFNFVGSKAVDILIGRLF